MGEVSNEIEHFAHFERDVLVWLRQCWHELGD